MQICSKVTSMYLLVFKSKLVLLYELFGQSSRSLNNEAGFQGKKIISSFFNKMLFSFYLLHFGTQFINYLSFNWRYILKIICIFQIRETRIPRKTWYPKAIQCSLKSQVNEFAFILLLFGRMIGGEYELCLVADIIYRHNYTDTNVETHSTKWQTLQQHEIHPIKTPILSKVQK